MKIILLLEELEEGQVALLRVDPNTGTPMNRAGDWSKAGEEEYLSFESEELARAWAMKELKDSPLNEWSLIDDSGNQIDVLHNQDALASSSKKEPKSLFKRMFGK